MKIQTLYLGALKSFKITYVVLEVMTSIVFLEQFFKIPLPSEL